MDTYFQGTWRMDWGFGNANKTAALIALLMIGVWGGVLWRRSLFWPALLINFALGVCLMHTFSRGGVAAAVVGLFFIIWRSPKSWGWIRICASGAVVVCIIGVMVDIQAYKRFGQGLIQEDRSITNRLALWNTVPKMIADSPSGWGFGNSGSAYVNWYQPLERSEPYRTLVNSHFTWLVESGWTLRFCYLLFWAVILCFLWPSKTASEIKTVGFAVWIAFAITGFFSSVAENKILWIIPLVYLAVCIMHESQLRNWCFRRNILIPSSLAFVGISALFIIPRLQIREGAILKGSKTCVQVGKEVPRIWAIVTSETVGINYGRAFRTGMGDLRHTSIGLTRSWADLPKSKYAALIVLTAPDAAQAEYIQEALKYCDRMVLVNPNGTPVELGFDKEISKARVQVIIGSFSQKVNRSPWENASSESVLFLPGEGDYIANWMDIVARTVRQSISNSF